MRPRNYLAKGLAQGDILAARRLRAPTKAEAAMHCAQGAWLSHAIPGKRLNRKLVASFIKIRGLGRRGRQHVILEAGAQFGFQDFSGRGVRDFGDENDVVGDPPARDLALEE